jgi:phage tail-like protein
VPKIPGIPSVAALMNGKVVSNHDNDSYYAENPTSATFSVVVDNNKEFSSTRWTEISGLSFTVEVVEHAEGGENGFTHKFPGRFNYPNITLTRGVTANDGFHNWIKSIEAKGPSNKERWAARFSVTINLLSASGATILRSWTLHDAFPVSWTGPSFTAATDNFLTEKLVLAHSGFSVETRSRPKPKPGKSKFDGLKESGKRKLNMLIEQKKNQAKHAAKVKAKSTAKEAAKETASAVGGESAKKAVDKSI